MPAKREPGLMESPAPVCSVAALQNASALMNWEGDESRAVGSLYL
jgi:hypothetical protein